MSAIPNLTSISAANELMLSHVWRYLPTSLHNAYVCSSGSKGYCALKETLQNGIPGHTLLIESSDLRDVSESGSEGHCCLVYVPNIDEQLLRDYKDHIPPAVTHVDVYGNVTCTPSNFLKGCTGLTSVDLSPLSQIKEVHESFLWGCTGLTSVDLSPLSQISEVHWNFLRGCTGLTSVALCPLSMVTDVYYSVLAGCTGLTSVDLSPLSRVRVIYEGFLMGCPQITTIDHIPLLCVDPPDGWLLTNGKWAREKDL